MKLAQLRKRYEHALAGITLPDPFDLEVFCHDLARSRGRALRLLPLPAALDLGPDAPCGLWLPTDTTDYICYSATSVPVLRDHIICHELGHVLCSHVPRRLRPELVQALTSDIRWDVTKEALGLAVDGLGRTSYSRPEEQEAEMVATLLLQRVARLARRPDTVLDRVEDSFG